jgi:hypothetical protein
LEQATVHSWRVRVATLCSRGQNRTIHQVSQCVLSPWCWLPWQAGLFSRNCLPHPAPYVIEGITPPSGTQLQPISRGISRVKQHTPVAHGETDAVLRASEPRQLPACGHVVCAACIVASFLDAMEEASFDESKGVCGFTKPQRLTEAQFAHFASFKYVTSLSRESRRDCSWVCLIQVEL